VSGGAPPGDGWGRIDTWDDMLQVIDRAVAEGVTEMRRVIAAEPDPAWRAALTAELPKFERQLREINETNMTAMWARHLRDEGRLE
jgi:hypothetical protein